MSPASVIYLEEKAVRHNWNFLRSIFPDKRLSAVVKGNAYGHGMAAYAPLAETCGVNHFSVFNAYEAYELWRVADPGTDIMIMGDMLKSDMEWAIEKGIEFYVFETGRLLTAIALAKKTGTKAKIHIEAETGMYRTGFDENQMNSVLDIIRNNYEYLELKGLCTHFAGAESMSNLLRIKPQISRFKHFIRLFQSKNIKPEMIHCCCSAAALRFPEMHYNLLRIGILQYGFWPNLETEVEYLTRHQPENSPLRRVISWETYVMSLKEVPANTYVGYGRSYYAQYSSRFAVVPMGYSNGFSRDLSNAGEVLIHGRPARVAGTVNMNCMLVDVSTIPEVVPGDKVVLIGKDGDREITVASFGEWSNQLNYELLTRLPLNIPRKVRKLQS